MSKDSSQRGKLIGQIMVALFVPGVNAVQMAFDRSLQQQSNLRIAFALAAYRSEHNNYPSQLTELAPKYLRQVPLDLFSGKTLPYSTSGGGYLLYSVGPNGKDDQARAYDDEPAGDDIRVRIPTEK
jgi:hypothetical protein